MSDSTTIVASPNIIVSLDGEVITHVVSFNTRQGRVIQLVKDDLGTWVSKESWGLVHADCDFTEQTNQALGSGEGTN